MAHPRRAAQVRGHPDIGDQHARADMAPQHIDGRAAGEEVVDHLRGHVRRIGADAFRHHAMIAGHHRDGFARHGGTRDCR